MRKVKAGTLRSAAYVLLATCFVNLPVPSRADPSTFIQQQPSVAAAIEKTAPLLDPERVPDGVAIEYGPRVYWRDPTTGKVFWAQKTFLASLFAQMGKTQAPTMSAARVLPPPVTQRAPERPPQETASADRSHGQACHVDLGDFNSADLMKSAAQIETKVGVCGGSRIADSLIITNGHCLIGPNGGWAQVKSVRGRESGMKARFIVNGQAHDVRCAEVMAISPFQKTKGGRDFAIVRCKGIPDDVPILRITEKEPTIRETVAMATYDWQRKGIPARIATGRVLGNDDSYLFARLKIIDGNSGSMIVNDKHELCGVANGAGEGPVAGTAFFHSMKSIMRQVKEQSPQAYAEIAEATNAASQHCEASAPRQSNSSAGLASRTSYR